MYRAICNNWLVNAPRKLYYIRSSPISVDFLFLDFFGRFLIFGFGYTICIEQVTFWTATLRLRLVLQPSETLIPNELCIHGWTRTID